MSRIGSAHSIWTVNGDPTTALMTMKTIIVGKNLKSAITTEESGNIIRGKAVFRISLCPEVTDLTPELKLLATK
jgi:hypothetical protein